MLTAAKAKSAFIGASGFLQVTLTPERGGNSSSSASATRRAARSMSLSFCAVNTLRAHLRVADGVVYIVALSGL